MFSPGCGRAPLSGPVPITPAVRAPGRDVRSLCDNGGVWHRRRRPAGEIPAGHGPSMPFRNLRRGPARTGHDVTRRDSGRAPKTIYGPSNRLRI